MSPIKEEKHDKDNTKENMLKNEADPPVQKASSARQKGYNLSIRKSSKVKQSNLDYILNLIGSFGLYQKLQFILVGFLAVVPSMAAYSYVFIAATPKFTCVLASEKKMLSASEISNVYHSAYENQTIITESLRFIKMIDTEKLKNKSAIVFDNSCQISVPQSDKGTANQTQNKNAHSNSKVKLNCLEWLYDESVYGPTISTEWNLVCLKSHLKAVTQNAYIIGTACAIFSGILSDKFGRKTAMMLMITLMAIVLNFTQLLMHLSILSVTQKFIIFVISRFFQGFAQTMYTVSFVLLMEITGPKYRVFAGNITAYSFAIGQMILAALAFYLRDWRKVMWSLALYVLPFFIYYWAVPESPRWLLNKDKVREAKNVLKRIAIMNNTYDSYVSNVKRIFTRKKRNVQENYLKNEESTIYIYSLLQEEADLVKKNSKLTYTQTFIGITKSKLLRRRSFVLFYVWSVILMVYLGIGMGMSNTMDKIINPYLIFLIQAVFEFMGVATCQLVLNRFGRKYPLIFFMFLASAVIILIPFTYKKYPIASCVFYLLAKYAISAAQLTSMIFTTELYPTPMRGTAVGLCASISRMGGVWAPQINVLSSTLGFHVPFVLFSAFSFIAGFLIFMLPETLNKNLPENVIEAEKLEKLRNDKK